MNDLVGKLGRRVSDVWRGMSVAGRVGVLAGAVGLLAALFIIGLYLGSDGDFELLFSNVDPQDAAEVVAVLRDEGVPYRLERGGSEIWVPAAQVAAMRLEMAARGLPRGGVVGFEAFDTTRLGMTDFERQVQYQRALQGELTRTIRAFDQVQDARVHIALPERSLFVREQGEPSASVVLELKRGQTLSRGQVEAILHLLSRSVEGLRPENITVVDTRGNVLSDLIVADELTAGSDRVARQLEVQSLFEQRMARDLEGLLERIYGPGKVVARVRAEIGFDHAEELSEVFTAPDGSRSGLPRSEQRSEERYEGTVGGAGGVAGVTSNIPGYVGDAESSGVYELLEQTINYELNRFVATRHVAPGAVRRLSVAVVVDAPLDAAAEQSLRDLVGAAVGFDRERGDVISVQSMQFEAVPVLAVPQTPVEPERGSVLVWLVLAAIILLAAITVVVLRRRRRSVGRTLDITVAEEVDNDQEPAEDQRRDELRRFAQSIAQSRPQEAAQLIRAWIKEK